MPKLNLLALVLCMSAMPVAAQKQLQIPNLDLLTGLPRLACEAVLCLSSGEKPADCKPSVSHYFDIEIFKKGALDLSATLDARRAFLNICPSGGEPGMQQLINAITQGAGRCDAAYLNKAHRRMVDRTRRVWQGGDAGEVIYVEKISAVNNTLPAYCIAYYGHEWTRELNTKYVGTPCTGGHWVEAKNYESELLKWKAEWTTRSTPQMNTKGECTWSVNSGGAGDN